MNPPTIYLASGSPRRREILTNLGYHVLRLPAEIDETPYPSENATDYVQRMARMKNSAALTTWQQNQQQPPEFPLISADTTVSLNNLILGKPANPNDAFRMLKLLSGRQHQVHTAVCIYWHNHTSDFLQTSTVHFAPLQDEQITAYIATGEPLDKAGAYGIQGLGGMLVEYISGSFTGIMGLPVYETTQLLSQYGCTPLNQSQSISSVPV
ncbi:septum formation protein Maf [Snodgrassella communis]|uniref:Maf family protein n=1 Tax=Snodgrassella communis TaxID=2946699 RepID=UPI000C1F7943|nr:Maf family protein [Snodgrassella communis]PIT20970.1 septum formation protein Maf [Snodgrassella communis]PIT22226.1 septum formation protein Maf [Snodgrassella communis]